MSTEGHNVARPSGALFGCNVHHLGVTSVIELRGELDLAARATLDDALESALSPGLVMTVVADLDGGRFVTLLGNGRAGDVLRLTGVERRLDVVGGGRPR